MDQTHGGNCEVVGGTGAHGGTCGGGFSSSLLVSEELTEGVLLGIEEENGTTAKSGS